MSSFLELYIQLHQMRTSSPKLFGAHLGIQLLGHSMGRNSICREKPRSIHHNTYLCLVGESGRTMKTTAQEDIQGHLIPMDNRGPSKFSPEGLLKRLMNESQLVCPMGEFSTVLRGMKNGGYMATFQEIADELWTCPPIYEKSLTNAENSYLIQAPYLSISTTSTEEQMQPNLSPEMVHGGFMPRWIFIKADRVKKSREPLNPLVDDCERFIINIVRTCYKYFKDHPLQLELSTEARNSWFDICDSWEDDPKNELIQPFIARYERYLVAYADILKLSDLIGSHLSQHGSELIELIKYTQLEDLETTKTINLIKLLKTTNLLKSVEPEYIKKASKLITPSIKYARELSTYVDEDINIAKVKSKFEKFNNDGKMRCSKLLQYCGMDSGAFWRACNTLVSREEYKYIEITKGEGRAKKTTRYLSRR